ncbi:MAG: LLM class flavin-dependent oxidoreductase [Actinomycetota bacterium]|jgi:probable F420-dependent oxidoreductase|nr:LLM class flavin-dependent oxidoreductase [Actinomycetota bacterium]
MKIRFAISPSGAAVALDRFVDFVTDAEALGFDGVWLSDLPVGSTVDPVVGLSFAAAATTRIRLGANVVPLGRNPLLLAKSLAQVDQLSAGRLLLSFVVGLDQAGERQALGTAGMHRGRLLEQALVLLRAWWAGETVDGEVGTDVVGRRLGGLASPSLPYQRPLEVWFGGRSPEALDRVGRVADGWLGAAVTPAEAARAVPAIAAAAEAAGRRVDPEHFGLSVPYAAAWPDAEVVASLRRRRPDVDPTELVAVGPDGLRTLVSRYVAAGVSKFVVRPAHAGDDGRAALGALADVVLPLQT